MITVRFVETTEFDIDIDADDWGTAKTIALEKYDNGEVSTDDCYQYTMVGDEIHGYTVESIGWL